MSTRLKMVESSDSEFSCCGRTVRIVNPCGDAKGAILRLTVGKAGERAPSRHSLAPGNELVCPKCKRSVTTNIQHNVKRTFILIASHHELSLHCPSLALGRGAALWQRICLGLLVWGVLRLQDSSLRRSERSLDNRIDPCTLDPKFTWKKLTVCLTRTICKRSANCLRRRRFNPLPD